MRRFFYWTDISQKKLTGILHHYLNTTGLRLWVCSLRRKRFLLSTDEERFERSSNLYRRLKIFFTTRLKGPSRLCRTCVQSLGGRISSPGLMAYTFVPISTDLYSARTTYGGLVFDIVRKSLPTGMSEYSTAPSNCLLLKRVGLNHSLYPQDKASLQALWPMPCESEDLNRINLK